MKEFVQEFKRVVRESEYERQLLIQEFKREMNKVIKKKAYRGRKIFKEH